MGKKVCFYAIAGACLALQMTAGFAQDIQNAEAKPLEVSTARTAGDEIRGKEAVIDRLKQLFKQSPGPVAMSAAPFVEQKPQISVIEGTEGRSTIIYTFRYIKAQAVIDAVEAVISDSGSVEQIQEQGVTNNDYNTVVINDIKAKIPELQKLLLELDRLQPQVLVEAQIIEVYIEEGAERDARLSFTHYDSTTDTSNTYGFNLDSPAQNSVKDEWSGFDFFPISNGSSDGSYSQLNAAIRWLNTSRDARILSAPNLIANLGAESKIVTGEDLPIPETTALTSSTSLSFVYRRIGVSLSITPLLINEKTAQLKVMPEITSAIRYQTFTQNNTNSNIPVISVRSIDTRLTVADGDIIVLGGLYSSEKNESLRKIPFFGDVPVLGDLINGRDTQAIDKQLIFFMKVHILNGPQLKAVSLDQVAHEIHRASDIIKDSNDIFPNKPPTEFFNVEEQVTRQFRLDEAERIRKAEAQAEQKKDAAKSRQNEQTETKSPEQK